jgi:hypothetical protein
MNDSQAREMWNSWTEAGRRSFIEYHEFNPRFASYSWAMLPYSVQQLVQHLDAQPHITGKCSNCGNVYIITGGIECTRCGWSGLAWAYHGTNADPEDETLEYLREKLGTPELTEGDKEDVAELERMFKLGDNRV